MMFQSWIRSVKTRSPRKSGATTHKALRGRRARIVPRVERLEERTVPSTFLVTNTADSGAGSLRQAILNANGSPAGAGPDTIAFNIPTSDPGYQSSNGGWFNITPLSGLPVFRDPNSLLLDGYSQPGARPNDLLGVGQLGVAPGASSLYGDDAVLKIVLDGIQVGNAIGLNMVANAIGGLVVQGLVIDRFPSGGTFSNGGIIIQGNFFGLDVTGTTAFDSTGQHLGNGNAGIRAGSNDIIGGAAPAARNIISGSWNPSGAPGVGVSVSGGPTATVVEGNFIGTDRTGTTTFDSSGRSLGNAGFGLNVYSSVTNNTIGGTAAGAGNLISGNGFVAGTGGINFNAASGNIAQGNFIGTDVTGTKMADTAGRPLGNDRGVIFGDAGNSIGGTAAGAGNLISGNTVGVDIRGPGNLVQGNFIGTDVSGTFALGNFDGIGIGGSNNTIGGTTAAAGNLISGNGVGIQISYASGNTVEGNHLGTDKNGAAGNLPGSQADQHGPAPIHATFGLGSSDALSILHGSNNTIGGPAAGAGNVIAYSPVGDAFGIFLNGTGNTVSSNSIFSNNTYGIYLEAGTGNNILSNAIYANGSSGIVFVNGAVSGTLVQGNSIVGNRNDGVTTFGGFNNTFTGNIIASNGLAGLGINGGSGYTFSQNSIYSNSHVGILLVAGANNNQSFPVLTSVSGSATATTITGTLQSVATTSFRLEFFSNTSPDPSGYGQGRTYLGFTTVTSDSSGNATFTASLGTPIPAGQGYVTATATNLTTGDTSQFARDVLVPIANAGGPYTIHGGDALTLTASATANPGGGTLSYAWDINGAGTFTAATGVSPTLTWAQLNSLGVNSQASYAVAVRVTDSFGNISVATSSLTVLTSPTALTVSAATGTYGGTSTFTATLTSGSSPVSGRTVVFTLNNVNVGSATTNASGVATLSGVSLGSLNVGTYASYVGVSFAGDANYSPSNGNANVTVTPAPLIVTADSKTRIYGVANPAFTVSYNGFVLGQGASVLGGTLSFTTPAVPASAPGGYAITPSGLTSSNYTITFVSGTLTITPAPLSATGQAIAPIAGAPFSGVVATVVNADPFGSPGSYVAIITWGNGNISAGTISDQGGGTFAVSGTNTYADPHAYSVSVQISHRLGYTMTAITGSTATITSLGVTVDSAQARRIGFWESDDGQALIASFNGGPSATALANWLASTFPNTYGSTAGGHNLTGRSNTQVAAFFQNLWAQHSDNPDVQVLATALNVYATTQSLGGTAGQAYNFRVSVEGLGGASFNVDQDGAAFGVANGTTLNVYQLLQAANQRAVGGVLYNGDLHSRALAEDLFERVNRSQADQTEDIGFWNRDRGQALIGNFNGGSTSTALSSWLATTFPNLYGANAGSHNLTGLTNAQVAAFFQGLYAACADSPDVQALATALNVYATTMSLGGAAAQAYGFLVSNEGLGAVSFNVRQDGAAFGVANGTTLNVYELLRSVNQQAVGGVLFNGNAASRGLCEDLFERLDRAGS